MKKVLILAVLAAAMTGCATQPRQQLQGPVYSQMEGRNAVSVTYAQVLSVKPVIIKAPVQTTWQGTAASGAAGAAIGGALGNQIGKGNGKKLATTLGALGGAAVGVSVRDEIARQESEKQGVELIVRLQDGSNKTISVIQEVSNTEIFQPGQTVTLTNQRGGYHASPI